MSIRFSVILINISLLSNLNSIDLRTDQEAALKGVFFFSRDKKKSRRHCEAFN